MANNYKNIIITPNRSSNTADPKVVYSGGNTTANTDITLNVYPDSNGTLSWDGSAGQLFSITNDLSNNLFGVNDVSGIPYLEVYANGLVSVAAFGGNVVIGNTAEFILSPGTGLHANGSFGTAGQALTTNGSAVYWSTISGVNTAAQYTWTNTHTFQNTITFSSLINTAAINITGQTNTATLFVTTSANIASSNVIANTAGVFVTNTTGVVNAAVHSVGTSTIANSTGVYTGVVNGSSHTVGTSFTANATLVNAAAINITGQTNTATLFVTTSANIASSNVVVNTAGLFVTNTTGVVNAAVHSVGTSFIANTTQVTIAGIPLSANGGVGTAGQVLTTNGATGAPYWTTAAAGVNTAATYTWTNTHTYQNSVIFNSNVLFRNNATTYVGNTTGNGSVITLYVYPDSNGTLSWEGNAGQLFSITNDLSNNLFGVNDVSGIPYIEVYANGLVSVAPISGNVGVRNTAPSHTMSVNGDLLVNTDIDIGNSSVNAVVNSTAFLVGNITTGTGGLLANTTRIFVGNNTINAAVNTTTLSIGGTLIANSTGPYGKTEGNLNVNSATQATNATNLNSQPGSFYTNATNITTGTLPYAQIPANIINTTAAFTISGIHTYNANIVLGSSGLSANGSFGTAGHVLHSNGTATYWAADDNAGGTVTSVASGNGITGGTITTTGTLTAVGGAGLVVNTSGINVLANTGIVANSTGTFVNATYIGTLSANNASFLGGTAAASYQLNSTLGANIASYLPTYTGVVNGSSHTVGTSFTANSTVVNAVSYYAGTTLIGNTTGPYGKTEGSLNVNSATQATNATNLNSQPGSFYTNATNITTGTLPYAQIPANIVNTTGSFTISGVHTHNANVSIATSAGIIANGTIGTVGQVLASNGSSVYWVDSSDYIRQSFTGDGVTTSFTVTGGYTANQIDVYVNGLKMASDDVTISSGTSVVFIVAPPNGSVIDVIGIKATIMNFATVNTSAAYTWTNTHSFTNTVTLKAISANGGLGTAGQALISNGTSTYWGNVSSVSGSDTQVQYNDGGFSNASAGFVFTKTTNNVTVANSLFAAVVNAASHTVGVSTIANSTGVYTGVVNGSSITVGTSFTANSILVNTAAINITGQTNTATLFVTTSANIASSNVIANTAGVFVANSTGIVNAAVHSVGTSFIANSTGVYDVGGNVRDLPILSKAAVYQLASSDTGEVISTTANVTVNGAVLLSNQNFTIFNNSAASITIVSGTGATMYLAGTSSTGNRTLSQRGLATVLMVASNTFVISGSGLS